MTIIHIFQYIRSCIENRRFFIEFENKNDVNVNWIFLKLFKKNEFKKFDFFYNDFAIMN